MRWVGIDEAGYGPNLGPMVLSAVIAEDPSLDRPPDLWGDLPLTVRRAADTATPIDRLWVDDSKAILRGGVGREHLETTCLATLAARLAKETGRSIQVLPADLGDKAQIAKVEAVLRDDPSITLLVNNAGAASVAPLLDADVDAMAHIIEINVTALTRLAYAVAPAFVRRGAGTIVNIGSVVGVSPETLNGVYGATKAYVLAFSHSLQHELADKGLRIQAVLPGATATDLWEGAGLHYSKLPAEIVMSAEEVVDAALAGLDHGELVTIPPLQDGEDWTRFEAARRALSQRFGHSHPGPRYRAAAVA